MRTIGQRSLAMVVLGLIAFVGYEWSQLASKTDAIPSARPDMAWYTEYNWFWIRATGTNGRGVVGQMFFTGFDFAL